MQINDFLLMISLLGISQGMLITGMLVVRSGKRPNREWLLCGLFLTSIVVMTLVTSVNSGWVTERRWMTIIEVFMTLLIGPMLYWYTRWPYLEKPVAWFTRGLHFFPALLWMGIASIDASLGSLSIDLPFFVFILHFQVYILASALFYFFRKAKDSGRNRQPWTALLLNFFLVLCIGQWFRFAFLHWEALQLIVPSAAACSFYLITVIGLQRSSLWPSTARGTKQLSARTTENTPVQLQTLDRLMQAEEYYRDPQLNRNKLALALDISPNQLTQLIQQAYGMGFTDYIHHWRLQKAKALLLDPERQHLTVEAIGQEAGFQSRSAFYRIFKAEMGKTPAAYRKE